MKKRRYKSNPIQIYWPVAVVAGPVAIAVSAWLLSEYKSCDEKQNPGDVCVDQKYRWFVWAGLVLGGIATTAAVIHYSR